MIGIVGRVIVELCAAQAVHCRPIAVRDKHAGGKAKADGDEHEKPVDVAEPIAEPDAFLQRFDEPAGGRVVDNEMKYPPKRSEWKSSSYFGSLARYNGASFVRLSSATMAFCWRILENKNY